MKQIDLKCLRDILDELIKNGYETNDIDVNVTLDFKDDKCDNEEDREKDKENKITSDDIMQLRDRINDISVYGAFGSNASNAFKHPLAKQVYLKLEKDLPYLVNPNYGFKVEYNEDGTTVFNMGVVKLIFHNNNNDMIYFNIAFPNEFKVPLNALFDNVLDSSVEVPMNLIADFVKSGVMYADKLFTPFSMYYISDVMLGTKKNMKVMDLSYIKYIQKVSMFLKDKNQFREITNKVAKIIGSLKEIITSKESLSEHMLETLDILPDKENKKTIFSYVIYTE